MKWSRASLLSLSAAATVVHSRPSPQTYAPGAARSAVARDDAPVTNPAQLDAMIQDTVDSMDDGRITSVTEAQTAIMDMFRAVRPMSTPTSIPQALQVIAAQSGLEADRAAPSEVPAQSMLRNALGLVLNGFTSGDLEAVVAGASPLTNSADNNNPSLPSGVSIYPFKAVGDAPYSVSEEHLRAAIYIPPTFAYGATGKKTVIMSPGTGVTGGINFEANLGKLLAAGDIGDPVYLNIPGNLLADAQINAEYVAYALNYMSEIQRNSKNVSIVAWSQGSLDSQWALKYWPSTRRVTEDAIIISPDYKGTLAASLICARGAAERLTSGFLNRLFCSPAVDQQVLRNLDGTGYSDFVAALRADGGDSAYVPTTTIFSLTDEVVQPQRTEPNLSSAYMGDARAVGASNTQVQSACPHRAAGGIYTHEGVLYNPIAYGLLIDALTHDGPGQFSRLDPGLCDDFVAPGLSLRDVLETEATLPLALVNVLRFPTKIRGEDEPSIMAYALGSGVADVADFATGFS